VRIEYDCYLLRLRHNQAYEHWSATLQNAQSDELLHLANDRTQLRYLMPLLLPGFANADQPTRFVWFDQ